MKGSYQKVCLLAVMAFFIAACSPQRNPPITFTMETPQPTQGQGREEARGVRGSGKVTLSDSYNLSFTLSGQIVELNVKEGDTVAVGDQIARLDDGSLQTEISLAEAALHVAQVKLQKAMAGAHPSEIKEAEARIASAEAAQSRTLAEATQVAADVIMAQARLEFLLAQPLPEDIATAQAEVDLAQRRLDAQKARLPDTVLVSPVAGIVTRVYHRASEYTSTGSSVVQIADLTSLGVDVVITDLDANTMQIGDPAQVTAPGDDEQPVQAVIVNIQPNSSSQAPNTFIVTVALQEPSPALRLGVTAQVFIPSK